MTALQAFCDLRIQSVRAQLGGDDTPVDTGTLDLTDPGNALTVTPDDTNLNVTSVLKENTITADLAVSGKDLAAAGIPSSPEMGRLLEALLDEVMGDKLKNEKDSLLKRAEEIYKTMKGS